MMSRRGLFGFFVGCAVAPLPLGRMASGGYIAPPAKPYVVGEIPSETVIRVDGNACGTTVEMIRAEIARSNAALVKKMNRDLGNSIESWNRRFG